jgi:diguanylate cyclase (GGDEF)-like protein
MELRIYLNILLKKWWIVISVFLVTLTAGLVLTYTQRFIYSTTATYVVVPSNSFSAAKDFANGLDMLGRRDEIATTFSEIAASQTIKKQAIASLSLDSGRDYAVSSKLRAGTNILEFTVQGPDSIIARDLANGIGAATEEYIKGSYEVFALRPLDEATTPTSPVRPNRPLYLILTAILGLVLGMGLAFLSVYLETPPESIANFNILEKQTGLYNKEYFLRRLGEEMVRAKRNRYPLSVALMRIDNLGLLNGANSAKTRAGLLHQIARLSKQYLREEDLLAYLGNDTFATLLPDMTGENAKVAMEYLQTLVDLAPFEANFGSIKINPKGIIGITTYNHNGTSRDDLVAQADRALRLAEVSENGSIYLMADPVGHKHD